MGKPLVTVIDGPAAGAGFSLALLGDIVLAARSAHFTLTYGGHRPVTRWRRNLVAASAGQACGVRRS